MLDQWVCSIYGMIETGGKKSKYSEENLWQCHCVHHKIPNWLSWHSTLVSALKGRQAHSGRRITGHLFPNFGAGRMSVVNTTACCFSPEKQYRYPSHGRLGGFQSWFRRFGEKSLAHTGIRARTVHPVAQSLPPPNKTLISILFTNLWRQLYVTKSSQATNSINSQSRPAVSETSVASVSHI